MQANLMTENLRAALARRGSGQPTPAIDQQTQPGMALPTGGPNTPTPQAPQAPEITGQAPSMNVPAPAPTAQPQPQAAMGSGSFDDQTKTAAKVLVAKLIKYL